MAILEAHTPRQRLKLTLKRLGIRLLLLRYGWIRPRKRWDGPLRRVVILSQEKFGDTILLTALLRALKRARPDVWITVVAVRPMGEILDHCPYVDALHNLRTMDRKERRRLFRVRFDLLFNAKDHPSSTFVMLSRRLRARRRVGIDHPLHRGHFHHLLALPEEMHLVRKHLALLPLLGITPDPSARPEMPSGPVSPAVRDWLAGLPARAPLIGINLSATGPLRSLPTAYYAALIAAIDLPILLIALPERAADKAELERRFPHVQTSPATATIFDAAAVVARLSVLVTPDTSLVHIASCFDIPVVALYRVAIDLHRFGALSRHRRTLLSPAGDVNGIPAADAVAAFRELWDELQASR